MYNYFGKKKNPGNKKVRPIDEFGFFYQFSIFSENF